MNDNDDVECHQHVNIFCLKIVIRFFILVTYGLLIRTLVYIFKTFFSVVCFIVIKHAHSDSQQYRMNDFYALLITSTICLSWLSISEAAVTFKYASSKTARKMVYLQK